MRRLIGGDQKIAWLISLLYSLGKPLNQDKRLDISPAGQRLVNCWGTEPAIFTEQSDVSLTLTVQGILALRPDERDILDRVQLSQTEFYEGRNY